MLNGSIHNSVWMNHILVQEEQPHRLREIYQKSSFLYPFGVVI